MAKLGEVLVEEGIITEELLQSLLTRQQHHSGRLGRVLVEIGFLEEGELLTILSRLLGFPAVDLDGLDVSQRIVEAVPREMAAKFFFMPINRTEGAGRPLSIAVPDPTNQRLIGQIKHAVRSEVKPYVATETAILRALERYYRLGESDLGAAYQGYASVGFSAGERALWQEERRKMLRARRMDQLMEATLLALLTEKGYFTRQEYERRLQGGEAS